MCILINDTKFENAHFRFIFDLTILTSKFAIILAQIWISIAFWLSPKKYFNGKFCFNCLNNVSICQRFLYINAITSASKSKLFVIKINSLDFEVFQYAILLTFSFFSCLSCMYVRKIYSSFITPLSALSGISYSLPCS